MLVRRGYAVPKESIPPRELEQIKRELTVAPYVPPDFQVVPPTPFKVYLESATKIYLPKCYGLERFGVPNENRIVDTNESIDIPFAGQLRPEQIEPVDAFMAAANDPKRMGGILNLQCAAGKTVMAIYIICRLAKKALIIVHKEFLIQQWKERIAEFAPTASVGIIKAKVTDTAGKDIVIASLQSLSMKEYDPSVFDGFGTLVIDEVHHTGAEVFSRALQKVNVQYTLGLSATVTRKDGLSKVFMWHLGGIVFKRTKAKKQDTIQVQMHTFQDTNTTSDEYDKEYTIFGGKPNMAKMINNICEYQPRIEFAVELVKAILDKDPERRILVLSDRRNHLSLLKNELDSAGFTDNGYYYGGMKQEDLKLSEDRQIILGTYSMISEGFDVKGLDTLILASPKSDIVQSVGRILREKPENRRHVPLVIDIVDDFSLFSRQAQKRKDYYKSCKYDIDDGKKKSSASVGGSVIELKDYVFLDLEGSVS